MQIKIQPMGYTQTNCYVVTINGKDLIIDPGLNGTLAPITVEVSYDLEVWTLLDPFLILGFENPVPTGEVWPIVLLLSGDQNFIRLRAEKP